MVDYSITYYSIVSHSMLYVLVGYSIFERIQRGRLVKRGLLIWAPCIERIHRIIHLQTIILICYVTANYITQSSYITI